MQSELSSSISRRDLVKRDLDPKWSSFIEIKTDTIFEICFTNAQENKVTDGVIKDFCHDLEEKLKEYTFTNISELGLLIDSKDVTDQGIKELSRFLTTLDNVQTLIIDIKAEVSDVSVRELGNAIGSSLKNLENLHFDILGGSQVTDKSTEDLLSNISNLPLLTKLSLFFRELENLTDEGIAKFGDYLSNTKILQHLALYFTKCLNITDKGLKELSLKLDDSFKNLQSIHFSFKGCSKITDEGLKDLSHQINANLKNLTGLTLDFTDCHEITDRGIKELSSNLLNLGSLEKVSFWFTRCNQLTDKSVKALAGQIGDFLKQIKDFELDVAGDITDAGLKELVLLLTNNLMELQRLHIEVAGKITDAGLKEVVAHLVNDSKKLVDLHLNLSGCPEVTPAALSSAKGLLKEIKNLIIL